MPERSDAKSVLPADPLPPFLDPGAWATVAEELNLTPRQAEIVRLLLLAKKDKQIAANLGIGVPTVRMHLRHVFAHLHISDRMELALRVFQIICRDNSRKTPTHHK